MKRYKLRFDYDIVDIDKTQLAIFNDGSENAFIVNEVTAYMLCLLQQENTIGAMEKKLKEKYDMNPALIRRALLDLIDHLQENHLLKIK